MFKNCPLTVFKIWLVGEDLRQRMRVGVSAFVRDRKYHLRKYPSCFVGTEVVDWLSGKNGMVRSREVAVREYIELAVSDDHLFKDESLFYRFCKDDDTWVHDELSNVFHRGQQCYDSIRQDEKHGEPKDDSDVVRCTRVQLLATLTALGDENGEATVEEMIENSLITPGTIGDDGDLWYEFLLNYNMKRSLKDIIPPADGSPQLDATRPINFSGRRRESAPCTRIARVSSPPRNASYDSQEKTQTPDRSCMQSTSEATMTVMVEDDVSPELLDDPATPFTKRSIRVYRDHVGYGFVIRGQGPTYVTTVDPIGPAACSGIREQQYIHSVDGHNVLRSDHKEVARQISSENECVDLIVMEQIHDKNQAMAAI